MIKNLQITSQFLLEIPQTRLPVIEWFENRDRQSSQKYPSVTNHALAL